MIWALLFILAIHLEAAFGADPDHMTDYMQARDRCTFKRVPAMGGGCGTEISSCEVEVELAEGSGYYRFTRFGPFTSTGGTQKIFCDGMLKDFGAAEGTYMTRSMSTVIEPYTGMLISYPPVHLHHAHMFEGGYRPPIPDEMLEHMPWITEGFTGSASSEECMHAAGGPSCYNVLMPAGAAMKRYSNHTEGDYQVYIEDIRSMGSPPISTAMEFGSFILTKPNPALPPPKPTLAAKFGVGDYGPLGTYAVPYDTENFQVGTFHFAFKIEMTPYKIHNHANEGDEMWIIRGTQEEMGVPEHLRSPIATGTADRGLGQIIRHSPYNLGKGESLAMWKARFEKSMLDSGIAWEERTKTEEKNAYNSGGQSPYFVPFNEKNPQPSRSKPEILCKYYSLMEHVTPEWIAADKADLFQLMSKGGHQHFTSEKDPFSRFDERGEPFPKFKPNHDKIGPDGYVLPPGGVNTHKPIKNIVPDHLQYQNFFQGVLPGIYYRKPRSALLEGESEYTQCGTAVFEAGDYFTLIGFNTKRTNPEYDSKQFFGMPNKNQHTVYAAIMHLPDVPWFY